MTSVTEHCCPAPPARRVLPYSSWSGRLLASVRQLAKWPMSRRLELDQLSPHLLRDLGLADPACRDDPWLR